MARRRKVERSQASIRKALKVALTLFSRQGYRATSHFILAIMALTGTVVHIATGSHFQREEQVHAAAPEFACRGTRQDEPVSAPPLDESVGPKIGKILPACTPL